MPAPTPAALAAASICLQRLLEVPPQDWDALQRSVHRLDAAAARQVLMELYEEGAFPEHLQALFMALAEIFVLEISPEMKEDLVTESQAAFMASLVEDPAAPGHLARTMAMNPPTEDDQAIQMLDRDRRAFMVPAWIIFGPALTRPELASAHPFMVEAIAAESARASLDIWDDLLEMGPAEPARTLIQKALMRERTASIPGQGPPECHLTAAEPLPVPVRAFFSECDGTGVFTLLLEARLPNGSVNLHHIALRLDQVLNEGFTMAGREPDSLDDMLEAYLSVEALAFTQVPAAQAADWARAALAGGEGDPEARQAAAHLVWSAAMGRPAVDEPTPLPVSPVRIDDDQEIEKLFLDTHLSWYLKRRHLEKLGIDTRALVTSEERVPGEALSRVYAPPVLDHMKMLMRHMSLYRRYAGTGGGLVPSAGFYEALIAMLDDPSQAVRVMWPLLQNSIAAMMAGPERPDVPMGNPLRRERLRQVGFARLTRPRGKHMAYLDFAEVAHAALETIAHNKGPDYLAEAAYAHMAVAMGKAFVDAFFELGEGGLLQRDPRRFKRLLNAMKKHGGLDADRAEELWNWMVDLMEDFQDRVCGQCPVDCLARPTGNLEEWFFREGHPGLSE